jgi:hypothetical protein
VVVEVAGLGFRIAGLSMGGCYRKGRLGATAAQRWWRFGRRRRRGGAGTPLADQAELRWAVAGGGDRKKAKATATRR